MFNIEMKIGGKKEINEIVISAIPTIATFLGSAATGDLNAALIATGTAITSIRLSRFVSEYEAKEKNKELKDVSQKERYSDSLIDLLKYLGKELPSEEKWNVMRALFFIQVSKDTSESDEQLAYLLMEISKHLSSTEIMIIIAAYKARHEIANDGSTFQVPSSWSHKVAKEMGDTIPPELVKSYCDHLMELGFLNMDVYQDNKHIQHRTNGGLTTLAIKFCEFLEKSPQTK